MICQSEYSKTCLSEWFNFFFSTRECEKYAYTSHARMLTQSEVIMHIQSLYDVGEMQATQYDDLMRYIQDM